MPIYAYRCATCGHAKDVLQKMSDPVLSTCPACGAPTFQKQVTAAGFQLKGSGWYVTDFRGDSKKTADKASDAPAEAGSGDKPASSDAKPAETPAAAPAALPPATARLRSRLPPRHQHQQQQPAAAAPAAPTSKS